MDAGEQATWRARPALTAAIGGAGSYVTWRILDRASLFDGSTVSDARVAFATAAAVGVALLIFTLEHHRPAWSAAFGLAGASIAGMVVWWNGGPGEPIFWDWHTLALFLSIAIAAPLFQTARDAGAARFPYREVHGHAWTNVILWFAGWAFCLIVFLLAWLLAALFQLIGITALRQLLANGGFSTFLLGAAVGGGIGLLRENDRLIRVQQRVVLTVLGVLIPVLGAGLVLFLLALPFTGLGALWDATKATTPILLTCVIGALILINAAIGDAPEDEAANPILRAGALALALTVLPLAIIAATAVGLRIGQYGLSPDRLWALTFVAVAAAYGLAYLVALGRNRHDWMTAVRPANLRLAFGLAVLALVLATPIVSFNAIAARDQVARLTAGRVAPDRFDWAALRFDFGEAGKAAVRDLARNGDARIAQAARQALGQNDRYELARQTAQATAADTIDRRVRVLPAATVLPDGLKAKLIQPDACGTGPATLCTILYRPGAQEAIALETRCGTGDAYFDKDGLTTKPDCVGARFRLSAGKWQTVQTWSAAKIDRTTRDRIARGYAAGAIEVRPVTRRQVFVGGVPVGEAFD